MTSTPSPKKRLGKKSSSPNEITTQVEQKRENEKENVGAFHPIKEQSKVISEAELGCQNMSDLITKDDKGTPLPCLQLREIDRNTSQCTSTIPLSDGKRERKSISNKGRWKVCV